MTKVKVQCGWCREWMRVENSSSKYGYKCLTCDHCGRIVNSSKKESTGNIVGRKHIHRDLKYGDIV